MPANTQQLEILNGWKEIATYLGKGVRTVQRLERELNLPVHRPNGRAKGSVIAIKVELDAWVTAAPIRNALHLRPDWIAKNAIDTKASLDELRRQLLEARKLRQESAELRIALRDATASLRKNLGLSFTEEPSSERPKRADLLSLPSKSIH